MSIRTQHICDVCGTVKTESDVWFTAFVDIKKRTFRIQPFEIPIQGAVEAKHLCGTVCATEELKKVTSGE